MHISAISAPHSHPPRNGNVFRGLVLISFFLIRHSSGRCLYRNCGPRHSRDSSPGRGVDGALVKGYPVNDETLVENGSERDSASPAAVATKVSARSRRHWSRRLLWGSGIFLVVFVLATLALFVSPQTDLPTHVDGILSLNGPDEGAREALAVSLADKGYARVLLFSQGSRANDSPCPKVPRVSVICFFDVTNNTRGEARWAGQYAERHHWNSLLIVPGRVQATRARLLVERCFPGQVVVVPATEPLGNFPGDIVHEWGGLFAALLIYRGC